MQHRATLLPTPGDPFLVSEWLRNLAIWPHQAGRLYVQISWPQPDEVIERIMRDVAAAAPGSVVLPPPAAGYLDHGQAMHRLLDRCEEPLVQFTEDDLYIRNPGFIDWCWAQLESGEAEIVAVPRGSMSAELANVRDDTQPGLWPHLLFGTAEMFRSLEEPFRARIWQPGELVRGLGYHCLELCSADTFCAAAMELRSFARVRGITSPSSLDGGEIGDTVHIGSLSSGPVPNAAVMPTVTPQESGWGARIAWWRRCARNWPGGLEERHAAYTAAVEALVAAYPDEVAEAEARQAERVCW